MPRRCAVLGCRSNYDGEPYTNVFSFPRDPEMSLKWKKQIHRENLELSSSSVVCIKHFDEKFVVRYHIVQRRDKSLLITPRYTPVLTPGAFPTLFLTLPPKKKLPKKRKSTKEKCNNEIDAKQEKTDGGNSSVGIRKSQSAEAKALAVVSLAVLSEKEKSSRPKSTQSTESEQELEFVDTSFAGKSSDLTSLQQNLENNSNGPFESSTLEPSEMDVLPSNYDDSSISNAPSSNIIITNVSSARDKIKTEIDSNDDEEANVQSQKLLKFKTDDRWDAFGKYVAHRIREMVDTQKIFVEKIINEALFEGELGTLTRHHRIVGETQSSSHPEVQYNTILPYTVQRIIPPNSSSPATLTSQPHIHDCRSTAAAESQPTMILP